jgi:preprotein translocase subunit SecG
MDETSGKKAQNHPNSPLYKVGTGSHSPAPMILADISWLNLSINLLLVLFFIVCVMMVLIILMQRPKQEGLGAAFGTNVTDQVFGARTTNVLQRGTVYLATLFFVVSLVLAILIGHRGKTQSLLEDIPATAEVVESPAAPETPEAPETPVPSEVPATPLRIPAEQAPAEPAPVDSAPAEPEAPAEPVTPTEAPAPVDPAAQPPAGENSSGQ